MTPSTNDNGSSADCSHLINFFIEPMRINFKMLSSGTTYWNRTLAECSLDGFLSELFPIFSSEKKKAY